jgi:hypothetical protein
MRQNVFSWAFAPGYFRLYGTILWLMAWRLLIFIKNFPGTLTDVWSINGGGGAQPA